MDANATATDIAVRFRTNVSSSSSDSSSDSKFPGTAVSCKFCSPCNWANIWACNSFMVWEIFPWIGISNIFGIRSSTIFLPRNCSSLDLHIFSSFWLTMTYGFFPNVAQFAIYMYICNEVVDKSSKQLTIKYVWVSNNAIYIMLSCKYRNNKELSAWISMSILN